MNRPAVATPNIRMPVVESSYLAPFGFGNGHVQTIYAALFRKVRSIAFDRERIATPDADFLDLDWHRPQKSRRLVVISHGLESDSRDNGVVAMAKAFGEAGWDALAWNYRGCSGEVNLRPRSYHSGATEDLEAIVRHALATGRYERLALVGLSLGGNLTLKYLGDLGSRVDPRICASVNISAPCDIASSSMRLQSRSNAIYMRRFLRRLSAKVRSKMALFPEEITDKGLNVMRTFEEFDNAYTAPLHGFADARDYWKRASSRPVLSRIAVPTLLVNAENDPFLAPECFPREEALASEAFTLEVPGSGGHLGFVTFRGGGRYWTEQRALDFVLSSGF